MVNFTNTNIKFTNTFNFMKQIPSLEASGSSARSVMDKPFWEGAKEKRKNFRRANVNH
jgi:hypothetical protein